MNWLHWSQDDLNSIVSKLFLSFILVRLPFLLDSFLCFIFYFGINHFGFHSFFDGSMFYLFVIEFLEFNFYSSLIKECCSKAGFVDSNFWMTLDHMITFFNHLGNWLLVFSLFVHWMLWFLRLLSLCLSGAIGNSASDLQELRFLENCLLCPLILMSCFTQQKFLIHPFG